ncbi:hypothetical protein HC723_09900 [Vibrio sp. S11_S32]|uniref:hypothetical protein n=1 Tax=Vibrio sp. S11_S32 TaxID=2720225 RepID=UPI001680DD7A|nr:hypothetical protein [Vibrio sp. S11_S32]MBD1576749.1 hypothetical protein [Vibrio sp. S11_S32]
MSNSAQAKQIGKSDFAIKNKANIIAMLQSEKPPFSSLANQMLKSWNRIKSNALEQVSLPQSIAQAAHKNRDQSITGGCLNVLKWEMGTGKTKDAAIYCKQAQDNGHIVVFVAPTISLTRNATSQFNGVYYDELKKTKTDPVPPALKAKGILTCAPSALYSEGVVNQTIQTIAQDHPVTLVLDEFTIILERAARENALHSLANLIQISHTVAILDADINEQTLIFLKKWCPEQYKTLNLSIIESEHQRKTVDVYIADPDVQKKKNTPTAYDGLLAQIETDILNGKNVYVTCDTVSNVTKIAEMLDEIEDVKTLQIFAKNEDKKLSAGRTKSQIIAQDKWLSDPTEESLKYQAVICSPSVGSGVSIENDHFDCVYGVFSGGIVTPKQANQMIARVREVKQIKLCVASNFDAELQIDAVDKLHDTAEAIQDTLGIEQVLTDFDKFKAQLKAVEDHADLNWWISLIIQLMWANYDVNIKDALGNTPEAVQAMVFSEQFKAAKKAKKDQLVADLMAVAQFKYDELLRMNEREKELYSYLRVIAEELKLDHDDMNEGIINTCLTEGVSGVRYHVRTAKQLFKVASMDKARTAKQVSFILRGWWMDSIKLDTKALLNCESVTIDADQIKQAIASELGKTKLNKATALRDLGVLNGLGMDKYITLLERVQKSKGGQLRAAQRAAKAHFDSMKMAQILKQILGECFEVESKQDRSSRDGSQQITIMIKPEYSNLLVVNEDYEPHISTLEGVIIDINSGVKMRKAVAANGANITKKWGWLVDDKKAIFTLDLVTFHHKITC